MRTEKQIKERLEQAEKDYKNPLLGHLLLGCWGPMKAKEIEVLDWVLEEVKEK